MATNWSSDLDPAATIDVAETGWTLSTPRVLVAVVAISIALGSLGLALVGWMGWNRFGDHLSPLVYLGVLGSGVALVSARRHAARRQPTAYVVLALLATAVYLEAAYGDLDDWDRIVPSRDDVSAWLGRYHRALSVALALLAVCIAVASRRASAQGSKRPSRERGVAGSPR